MEIAGDPPIRFNSVLPQAAAPQIKALKSEDESYHF